VKVLIVDDHPIVVSGFKSLLEQEDITVVDAADAAAGLDSVGHHDPDVAVIDINLPGLSGFELTRRLLEQNPLARIVLFSMNDDPVFVAQAMALGAKGFVSKNDNPAHMLKAIRAVASGGTAWPPGTAARIAHLGDQPLAEAGLPVSGRDQEILRQLAKGRSLSEIADLIGVSYKTVAATCANLRTRLNARTQTELVAIAIERKLV
jgi:two-component system, NarL family, invasion response regulator UvrY